MLDQDADGAKALADAVGKLSSKQEAFDQLNTLFAEQALRLSQADDAVCVPFPPSLLLLLPLLSFPAFAQLNNTRLSPLLDFTMLSRFASSIRC